MQWRTETSSAEPGCFRSCFRPHLVFFFPSFIVIIISCVEWMRRCDVASKSS